MSDFRAVVTALDLLFRPWRYLVSPAEKRVEPQAPAPDAHLVCGVPDCADGTVDSVDGKWTLIACSVHSAITRHLTAPPEQREQQIIRVQDKWRQHGTQGPRK